MSEVNYNDGKWHGHNGEPCPVDPDCIVQVATADGSFSGEAGSFIWENTDFLRNPIVAFCVIEWHKKPRQWWCVLTHMFDTREAAERFDNDLRAANPGMNFGPIFSVREVLE